MAEPITHKEIVFKIASTPGEFNDAKDLFQQYARSLEIDLGFQDFDEELKTIHLQYGRPAGALLLAYKNEVMVGCAGIRRISEDAAELKRMFVKAEYRQYKIGRTLLELAINMAKELHYTSIRLDTLPTMTQALNLYRSFGFYEIPAYRFNPIKGAVYMEKKL